MNEQEIFEKLKDSLDNQYLYDSWEWGDDRKEVDNLEDYLRIIKQERVLEKDLDDAANDELKTHKEFIKYLADRAVGDTSDIIEEFNNCTYVHFEGYKKVTKEIINKNTLSFMKSNAILINVARGAITNEQDVMSAIKNGTIGGFGTDVYSTEPMPSDSPFISISEMPNVILTPHMAWGAYEARVRCVNEIAQNIKSFISGDNRNRIV